MKICECISLPVVKGVVAEFIVGFAEILLQELQ